jgi:hypothetical protein
MPKKIEPIKRTELDKLLLKNQSIFIYIISEKNPTLKIYIKC